MSKCTRSFGCTMLLVALAALLGACSSLNSTATSTEDDLAKVAAIERAASQSGVRVYWIRYPQKRVNTSVTPARQNSGS